MENFSSDLAWHGLVFHTGEFGNGSLEFVPNTASILVLKEFDKSVLIDQQHSAQWIFLLERTEKKWVSKFQIILREKYFKFNWINIFFMLENVPSRTKNRKREGRRWRVSEREKKKISLKLRIIKCIVLHVQ